MPMHVADSSPVVCQFTFYYFVCQVSSLEIERICNVVDDDILETAAIGVPPAGGGPEKLIIVVVFKDANESNHNLNKLMISFNSALQKKLNPLFKVMILLFSWLVSYKFCQLTNATHRFPTF